MRLSKEIIQQIKTIRVKRLLAAMPPIEHIDYNLDAKKEAEAIKNVVEGHQEERGGKHKINDDQKKLRDDFLKKERERWSKILDKNRKTR